MASEVLFENDMVRFSLIDRQYHVEFEQGLKRALDEEENEYVTGVFASAEDAGLSADHRFEAIDEYLFQICLAVAAKPDGPWQMMFRMVPPDEMGRMIAEEYLETKGK